MSYRRRKKGRSGGAWVIRDLRYALEFFQSAKARPNGHRSFLQACRRVVGRHDRWHVLARMRAGTAAQASDGPVTPPTPGG